MIRGRPGETHAGAAKAAPAVLFAHASECLTSENVVSDDNIERTGLAGGATRFA